MPGETLQLVLLGLSLLLTSASTATRSVSTARPVPKECEDGTLHKCLEQISATKGMPSTLKEIIQACTTYYTGMECVDNFSKKCLNEENRKKFYDSIGGAKETFMFLCNDESFKRTYLSHSTCMPTISPLWDKCASNMFHQIKAIPGNNLTMTCCSKFMYLRCTNMALQKHCDQDSANFLGKVSETLVRSFNVTTDRECQNNLRSEKWCTQILPTVTSSAGAPAMSFGYSRYMLLALMVLLVLVTSRTVPIILSQMK